MSTRSRLVVVRLAAALLVVSACADKSDLVRNSYPDDDGQALTPDCGAFGPDDNYPDYVALGCTDLTLAAAAAENNIGFSELTRSKAGGSDLRRGRVRRSVRPVKVVEIPETRRNLLLSLEHDYVERFSFKEPAPQFLEINPVMASISLRDGERLDYETKPEINFVVVITRVDSSSYYDEQPVQLKLTDVNDEVPQFQNVPRPFLAMVSADAPLGTSVYQLMAHDPDHNSLIQYTLESGGEECFDVDADTGVVRTKCSDSSSSGGGSSGNTGSRQNGQMLKRGHEYEIGVSAVDVRGEAAPLPQKSPTQSLKILVGERDPQFYELQYVTSIAELAPKQSVVIEIKALSHLGFPISYELTTESGGQSNEFAIDQRTGVVDLLRTLDYESDPVQYHLRVKAIENRRNPVTSSVNLIVNLIDVNDNAPTFPLSQYIVQGITETVARGTDIIQVTATDVDSVTNSQLTYSVSDGNFTVQTINNIGYIRTAQRLDYDSLPDHTYNLTVIATDNGVPALSGSANVRVSVTNVNDEDPVFAMSTIEHVQVSEDAQPNTVIHVLQAYDPDGDGVSYSFADNQMSHGPFSIDSMSGIITLVGALEKSRVTYRLDVVVKDDGRCCGGATSRSRRGTVIVEVKDVNNNAPRFPDCAAYAPVVMEKENVGMSVIQVRAVDLDVGANGNVTYSLVKSTDQGIDRFQIDPVSGLIRTADIFDREAKIGVTDFGVTVKAEDHGSPTLAGFCTFRVKIGDRNDNPPVFNLHEYSASIEESSPIGRRVKQVYATDRDAGDNARVEYELRRDPSGFFTINSNTGWVTVARPMTGQRKVQLSITASDRGDPPRSATVLMDIEITQTTNEYPQWVYDYSAAPPIRLSENAPVNFEVGRFRATSTVPDASLNYFIARGDTPEQNGEPKSFYSRMDEATNEMVLLTYRPLDYEALSRYTLTLKAANRAANPLHIDMRLNVELIDENDEIPQFVGLDENGRYPGSIAENLAPGAEFITVTATDKDEFLAFRKVTYRIKEVGEDYNKFMINSETGVVRTTASFDREVKNEYYVTVIAEDGAPSNRSNHYPPGTPNRGEAEIQIRVTDMNDNAPFFRERIYTARVPENTDVGTIVMTVTAEDLDEENGLTYSITNGNIGSAFEVVPDLGEIKVRRQLDYETGIREFRMTYRVFDDKFENSTTLVIHVLDVNDNPPHFDNAVYTVTDLNEEERGISKSSQKYLLTVRATDPDVDRRSRVRYAVTGQFADDGTFVINAVTGEVFVTRGLDRDLPRGRPVWNFNVLAHDEASDAGAGSMQPSLTGYAEVRVMPRDLNDNAPAFDRNRLVGRVPEHSRAGATVLTVIATDADNGNNGTVTYSLKNVPTRNGQTLFTVDPNNGLVTTVQSDILDRERDDKYHFIVVATDRGVPALSSSATVTVIVDDINDHAPVFTQRLYRAVMSENCDIGASITSVSATDKDIGTNAKLMYSLRQQDREYFTIATIEATNTGVLKVHKPIDYDSLLNPTFNVTVYVEDTDTTHIDTAFVEVKVIDYNDNAPVFNPNQQRVTVFENVSVATTLFKFSATDRDTGINKQFSYTIDWNTDPERKFSINMNGLITTAKTLDRETKPEHRVHVLAVDKGNPAQTGTGTLFVTLLDVNDNAPQFAADFRPVVYENQPAGQSIITISAVDRDSATNGPPFEFWLPCRGACPCRENPTCGDFSFRFLRGGGANGHGAGVVTSLRTFNREQQKEFYIPIVMRDSGVPPVSGTNTLTVTIGDVNDNLHHPAHKDITVYNYKGMFENIPLGNVYAADDDDWDVVDKTFTFVSNDAQRYFRLDAESGQLMTSGRVPAGVYDLKVIVYDAVWKREVISTVRVTVKNIKEEAIRSSGSLRFQGITAEGFISTTPPAVSSESRGSPSPSVKSRCDRLRELIASYLNVPVDNVDIFTVRNHPTLPRTIDVRYSAHGSPYYRSARLDGLASLNRTKIEEELGLKLLMVPVNECVVENQCGTAGGCTNKLIVIDNKPLVVNANASALIGVMSYTEAQCICGARTFEGSSGELCISSTCFNGGTCQQIEHSYRCLCPSGFDGPRCQQTKHTFYGGDSWALYAPLDQCTDSHTSLEFITSHENGVLLYSGPVGDRLAADEPRDFILLELRNGFPLLRIDHGSGDARLTIDGRDRNDGLRLSKLNDGQWHRIDIFQHRKKIRLIVDQCSSAKITETDRSSVEDRRACEAVGETPGDAEYVNVIQPLQLGGRIRQTASYPPDVLKDGFRGCIKNLMHNGQLYDLHIGQVGEQRNAADGCSREDVACSSDNPRKQSTLCGVNGMCTGSFHDNYRCECKPGWRGPLCSIPTTTKDFREKSFIEWNFQEEFYRELMKRPHETKLQLMFRTRQPTGLLLKAQNQQKSEHILLEIADTRVRFRFNLGGGAADQDVVLTHVNVSDGEWHAVRVERVGRWASLSLDSGEGRYFNESLSAAVDGYVELQVAQFGLLAGGDVRFPSATATPLVSLDFQDGCMNDIRVDGDWLPMDESQNRESHAADFTARSQNTNDGCVSDACSSAFCEPGLICVDIWRFAECRCPIGRRMTRYSTIGPAVCEHINECVELADPCHGGRCIDTDDGYVCECIEGRGGPTCAERQNYQLATAYINTGALLIIVSCLILLLLLMLVMVVCIRHRGSPHYHDSVIYPDDDIRENIMHYDEEGVGEQDQSAYDISQLKKPLGSPPRLRAPAVEKVMPPYIPSIERPKKWMLPPSRTSDPDMSDYINSRLHDADNDPNCPPYESVREYAYEGDGSTAGSLSSMGSRRGLGDDDWGQFADWGTPFDQLARLYGSNSVE